MNILFMGTADFSATVLKKLNTKHKITAVVTGVDKPSNRGKVIFSAVKQTALELNIPLLQFNKVSAEGIEQINKLNPDIVVTAAFGQILSDEFLKIPKFGTLNVHASLLPKYRGSSPIQSAILNGDTVTGITIMRTVREVDAGDILLAKQTEILPQETAGELFDRLADLGGEAICEAIDLVSEGKATFVPQNSNEATFCKMLKKESGFIDFNTSAKKLDCFVRGMTPWPSAYSYLDGKMFKFFKIEHAPEYDAIATKTAPSTVIKANIKDGLIVSCDRQAVKVIEIQPENGKRMTAVDYLKGHTVSEGARFGK